MANLSSPRSLLGRPCIRHQSVSPTHLRPRALLVAPRLGVLIFLQFYCFTWIKILRGFRLSGHYTVIVITLFCDSGLGKWSGWFQWLLRFVLIFLFNIDESLKVMVNLPRYIMPTKFLRSVALDRWIIRIHGTVVTFQQFLLGILVAKNCRLKFYVIVQALYNIITCFLFLNWYWIWWLFLHGQLSLYIQWVLPLLLLIWQINLIANGLCIS